MIREMRWVVGAFLVAVCLAVLASSSAQAGSYGVEQTYPPYPEVGSYVDHYGHAAAWAWESYERATQAVALVPAEATPVAPKVYVRRGFRGRWGYYR